ncbi:MAG: 1,4-dihydroxy-2-naphthoate octaprenyltransferase [Planctomycetes bacterium]|nr:1,4-dihydroxy-2-naphthoate octaprenyltransferase [Planctomycetota bacterium]
MNAFAWISSLTMILEIQLADFTTLKGANSNPICLLYSVSNIDFSSIKAIICNSKHNYQKVKTVENGSKKSNLKSLFQTSRPNFLAASAAPVLVGSTLAYAITGSFNFGLFILALLAIMLLHAGSNMANDYFDHISGNDWKNNNVTPFSGGSRSIQEGIISPRTELLAALVALAAGSAIGLIIVLLTKSLFILILGIIGLLGGFFYTAPPVKLGYRCVGELVIALLFGLLPVFGSYYLQTDKIDIVPLLPAGIVAVLIFLIIFINEFPDLAADSAVNKTTLIVRFGVPASVWIYRIVLISGFIFAAAMLIHRSMFFAGLLYLLTLPVAVLAVKAANKKDLVKPGLFRANQLTILLHTIGSLALTIGFIIMGLRYTAI